MPGTVQLICMAGTRSWLVVLASWLAKVLAKVGVLLLGTRPSSLIVPLERLWLMPWLHVVRLKLSPLCLWLPQVVVYTDASDTGWGVVVEGPEWFQLFTTIRQHELHITAREALAANFGLRVVLERGCDPLSTVHIQSDSVATVAGITKGSARFNINAAVVPVVALAAAHRVKLVATHFPGVDNPADGPSRAGQAFAKEDYRLKPEFVELAQLRLDFEPEVDLFASAENTSFPKFCSINAQP